MAGGSCRDIPSCVLLDIRGYDAVRGDDTTASSKTSDGLPISVSFRPACPPALSHFAFFIPGWRTVEHVAMIPRVLNADAGLFVLRVPRDRLRSLFSRMDYFVYKAASASHPAELHRLPKLGANFKDEEVAILSCGDGDFVVAVLRTKDYLGRTFAVHLFRSTSGTSGDWTSMVLPVEDPLRDKVRPIPDSELISLFHVTHKAITLGGDNGTVGWVDLVRGIILCDVLSENPELRDMPLPLPDPGNEFRFHDSDPLLCHDICVDQMKKTIKYVEMVINARDVPLQRTGFPPQYKTVFGPWKAIMYRMPIAAASWRDWHYECSIHSADLRFPVGDSECCKVLRKLVSSSEYKEEPLGSLEMGWPILSVGDDNIVHLFSQAISSSWSSMKAIIAVDLREGAVKGVAEIDTNMHFSFRRCHLAGWIPKLVNDTDARASGGQAKEHVQKPENIEGRFEVGSSSLLA